MPHCLTNILPKNTQNLALQLNVIGKGKKILRSPSSEINRKKLSHTVSYENIFFRGETSQQHPDISQEASLPEAVLPIIDKTSQKKSINIMSKFREMKREKDFQRLFLRQKTNLDLSYRKIKNYLILLVIKESH